MTRLMAIVIGKKLALVTGMARSSSAAMASRSKFDKMTGFGSFGGCDRSLHHTSLQQSEVGKFFKTTVTTTQKQLKKQQNTSMHKLRSIATSG